MNNVRLFVKDKKNKPEKEYDSGKKCYQQAYVRTRVPKPKLLTKSKGSNRKDANREIVLCRYVNKRPAPGQYYADLMPSLLK